MADKDSSEGPELATQHGGTDTARPRLLPAGPARREVSRCRPAATRNARCPLDRPTGAQVSARIRFPGVSARAGLGEVCLWWPSP